jgi:hypothetical protein
VARLVARLVAKLLPKLAAPGFSSIDARHASHTQLRKNHRAYLIVTVAGSFRIRTSAPRTGAICPSTVADKMG